MKKANILLNAYTYGNMEALMDYYEKKLKCQRTNWNVKLVQHFSSYKQNKILHYWGRTREFLQTYDLVISDYPTKLYTRSKHGIYMSHGYGTKKTPGNDEIGNHHMMTMYASLLNNTDYLVTLSDRDEIFLNSPAFIHCQKPEYVSLGLPRNDQLFDRRFREESRLSIIDKLRLKKEDRLLLFAPTYRGYRLTEPFPFIRKDFIELDNYLHENNWRMLFRPHYIESIVNLNDIDGLKNIILADFNVEPHTQRLLAAVDFLITDYSSIYVDYLTMDRPIAFIPFDADKYDKFRGLEIHFDNKVETPGPNISKPGDLIGYLSDLDNGVDKYRSSREESIRLFYKYFDGKSCARIWDLVDNIL